MRECWTILVLVHFVSLPFCQHLCTNNTKWFQWLHNRLLWCKFILSTCLIINSHKMVLYEWITHYFFGAIPFCQYAFLPSHAKLFSMSERWFLSLEFLSTCLFSKLHQIAFYEGNWSTFCARHFVNLPFCHRAQYCFQWVRDGFWA
jgi:hypothetical protein